jgi:hypothetical protein
LGRRVFSFKFSVFSFQFSVFSEEGAPDLKICGVDGFSRIEGTEGTKGTGRAGVHEERGDREIF